MVSEKMNDALNAQVNEEMFSAYLYLSMSAHFAANNLPGFANWMRVQTQEEIVHAMKIFDFLNERGGKVALQPIKQPDTTWQSPASAFEAAYKHEVHITACIDKLVGLARSQSDHATEAFLQWFVTEQVEEESSTDGVVRKLKLVGDGGPALLMLDNELAQRVFVPPASAGGPGGG